jgi:hypothetical protein
LQRRVGRLYNFTIDWGDGSPPQIITTDTSPTHSYPSVNPYSIQITENVQGGFPAIHFNNGGDRLKLMSISNWGDVSWSTMENAFYGCWNLHILASDTPRTGNVTDFSSAWRECTYMPSFPAIDTANGTNFSNTWSGCTGLSSFPTLNMGKMTDGTNCFGGVTLSPTSYSSLLIALATQNTAANNVTFSGGNSKFNSNAIASRAILTTPLRNWTITDGGIAPPVISSTLTASAEVGTPFTYQIVASNSPISYGASGLPAGLTLDVLSDTITGTPVSAGVSSVTISASNTGGTDDETLTLTVTVDPLAPVISSALTASGIVNQPFSYQITASNTPTGFNATGLPVGLSVNTATGLIDGTPTVLGTSLVTISATNADGGGIETLVLTIVAPGGGGGGGSGGGGGGGCGLGGGTAAGLLLGLAMLTLLLRSTGGRQRD